MSQEALINSTTSLNQIQKSSAATSAAATGSNISVDPIAGPSNAGRPIVNLFNVMQNQSQQMQNRVQDVRVDNWGNYCLQRLQVMYDRGDFCDLTLQFHNNQVLKVHRVVVNLCTEYFANLERIFGLTDGSLVLPKDIEYQAMVTIVKFFYTGKLEVRGSQFNDIYKTVKLMNITILTKLLEAHARKPIMQAKKEPTRPIVFKQAVEIGRPLTKGQIQFQNAAQSGSITLAGAAMVTSSGGTKTLTMPHGVKLPPGMKTKTVLARVQPQTMRIGSQQTISKNVSQKKLPIWKERKFSPVQQQEPMMWPPKDEPPRPTRFEWPDPDEDPPYVTAAAHTLMEKQKAAATARRAEDIFDAVKNQNLGLKRPIQQVQDIIIKPDPGEQPSHKVAKIDMVQPVMSPATISQPTENQVVEQSEVNLTEETAEEIVATSERVESNNEYAKPVAANVTIEVQNTLQLQPPSPKKGLTKANTVTTVAKPVPGSSNVAKPTQAQAKQVEKSVRFAPEVEKENKLKSGTGEIVVPTDGQDPLSNHSKIISEVLKKYPDLVKENKNIKLKIVQKGAETSPNKEAKSKVSYIVLKSTSAPDSPGSVVLKKPVVNTNKTFWDPEKVSPRKIISGAENTSGPWLCGPCGGGDTTPMEFESYYLYRRHLVEVHGERIDARICEYCGQKASKRNLLLYHMYTKHGVPPPKNCTFPHCDRCDYVALSESLLSKHKQGHDVSKEFSCTVCNASFKSNNALQSHMVANLHRNKDTKVYECPYCRKPFVRNINLKAHIRSLHKDVARIEEMEDPRLPPDDTLANRPVAIVHAGPTKKRQFPSILAGAHIRAAGPGGSGAVIITGDGTEDQRMEQVSLVTADGSTIEIVHGMDPSMGVPVSLVPTSDEMNVANSLAASLGLEAQGGHPGAEFVGVGADGTQAVYIVDNSQSGVEVDISGVGVGVSADGSMILEGEDPTGAGQFIVQDIHGNRFQKLTGIDENGKQVIFFQLSEDSGQVLLDENGMHIAGATRYEDGSQVEGGQTYEYIPVSEGEGSGTHTAFGVQNDHMYLDPQKCSVFVSSGMTMPVTVSTDVGSGHPTQVILSSAHDGGQIIEMVPAESNQHQQHVVVDEAVLAEHQQQVEAHQRQLSLVHHQEGLQHLVHDSMGQPVQELHIVLDDNSAEVEAVEHQTEGGNSQGVNSSHKQISHTDGELQISESFEQTEHVIVGGEIEEDEREDAEEHQETVEEEHVSEVHGGHQSVMHVTNADQETMLVIQDEDSETQVVEMVEEICEEETQRVHLEEQEEIAEELSQDHLQDHQVLELVEEETVTMTDEEIPMEMEVTQTIEQ